VDESADEKAGDHSAGAGKQYNVRMGKVETSQVGVLLSYVNLRVAQSFWTWLEGRVFLPEGWFEESHKALRERLGILKSRLFKTKVELAWELIVGTDRRSYGPRLVSGYPGVPGEAAAGHPGAQRQAWSQALTHLGVVWRSDAGRQPAGEADRAPHPGQNDGARRAV
jgi:hypothetical protein